MDVYSASKSPMTDNGVVHSDGEKECDSNNDYDSTNMEIKSHDDQPNASQNSLPINDTECSNDKSQPLPNFSEQTHDIVRENGHNIDTNQIIAKNGSVYDFNDSGSVSDDSHDLPMVNVPLNETLSNKNCELSANIGSGSQDRLNHSEFSAHNHVSHTQAALSHLSHQSYASHSLSNQNPSNALAQSSLNNHQLPHYPRHGLQVPQNDIAMDMASQAYSNSYDDSLSVVSDYTGSLQNNCFDGIRRARGRPRGSKNGTGMGRARARGFKFAGSRIGDERASYDLRHLPDPFSCQRRGRPRSRFIVDLGEQNHEAWTKSKEELNISDAELTTLLLSLLESRKDCKEPADSETMLGVISSEFKKWKEKFASQLSMLSHYSSIHNTNCCTCLGIKKKKYIPAGTGKRGRPRKYPPPVGYGPGMQRPDTIDEDGNIFEPQVILKDGMVVKAEPSDKDLGVGSSNGGPSYQGLGSPSMTNGDPLGLLLSRPLTQEEIEKRREYYNNHKNKIKYVCHYCQVHFYHKPNFDYHISKLEVTGKCKIVDKVNNLYLCETCGEGFSWREKLEKHLRLAEQHGTHNQKELLMYGDFQCTMCGKTFNKRTTYLQHVKWHEEREDIPCVICGTMFKQTELRHHLMEIHSNDSLPCSYCGKLFTSRKYLEKHELVHQGGNFPCPECGKIFTQKINMQAHLRTHSLDKEYPCENCGQMLNYKTGLCHHLKKHFSPSEFTYDCDVCGHYFSNDYFLKYHKKKVHNMSVDMDDDMADDYMSSPLSSHVSATDEDREKAYGAANSVVKNMLGVSLMSSAMEGGVNLTMKHEDSLEDGQSSMDHMRHLVNRTPVHLKDHIDQDEAIRMSDHIVDDQLHMPQDLTRMTTHLNEDRMSSAHMSDMRSATDSPVRMTDTPAHLDSLGRMSADNFGRMTGTPGGYLAEHLRRMAENQSRMSDSMSHYDDRDNYARLGDNLRSMSRGSDAMGRLGDNLSHMGVIRPSQSATSQWPPHMQNHALESINQSPQSSQHALYPLPFWPYDPSLRQYHH